MNVPREGRSPSFNATTAGLLVGCLLLNLFASVCFKEGGTDSSHRWLFFIGGNVTGISATALMMGVYTRMNVNIAMVLIAGGLGLLVQLTFWALYHSPLTGLQIVGIGLTVAGSTIASWPGQSAKDGERAC